MNKLILTPIAFLMFMLFSFSANAADYSSASVYAHDTTLSSELQFDVIKDEDDESDGDDDGEGDDE